MQQSHDHQTSKQPTHRLKTTVNLKQPDSLADNNEQVVKPTSLDEYKVHGGGLWIGLAALSANRASRMVEEDLEQTCPQVEDL